MAFALPDRDELALAIDIGQPQIDELGNPQASGIDRHQDRAMFEVRRTLKKSGHLGGTQHRRQFLLVAGIRNMLDHPLSTQYAVVEKTQCADGLIER
jgi:hypothetical protein